MRKIIAILTVLCFVVSYLPIEVSARDGDAAQIKQEIERHRQAIRNLKSQMKEFGGEYEGEDYGEDYSGEGYEGDTPPPPGKRGPKGRGPGLKAAPGKGKGLHKEGKRHRKGRGPGLKAAPGKAKSKAKKLHKGGGKK